MNLTTPLLISIMNAIEKNLTLQHKSLYELDYASAYLYHECYRKEFNTIA